MAHFPGPITTHAMELTQVTTHLGYAHHPGLTPLSFLNHLEPLAQAKLSKFNSSHLSDFSNCESIFIVGIVMF